MLRPFAAMALCVAWISAEPVWADEAAKESRRPPQFEDEHAKARKTITISNEPTPYSRVAIMASSTAFDETRLDRSRQALEAAGYRVTLRFLKQLPSDFGYVNTDQERARQLIEALLADDVDIVWFLKGGGGALNLLPYLSQRRSELKEAKPKVIVGYSDVTAIHSWVNEHLGWASVHGVNAIANREVLDVDPLAPRLNDLEPLPKIADIMQFGLAYNQLQPLNELAKSGVEGELRGGNLTLTVATFHTLFEPLFEDKLLFLEDVNVSHRQLDRYLQQLRFADLDVKAIIFGQFYKLDPTDEERLMMKSVLTRFAQSYNKPVYYFPLSGHGRTNRPLLLGSKTTVACELDREFCELVSALVSTGIKKYVQTPDTQ